MKIPLELRNISKSFLDNARYPCVEQISTASWLKSESTENDSVLLRDLNISVSSGELCCIVGKSGSGKSTLLHIAGLLCDADSGEVWIDGVNVASFSDAKKTEMRRSNIAFVYQFHHLLSEFSVVENLLIPQMIKGVSKSKAGENAIKILSDLDMLHKSSANIGDLSGGERQRVAIARALVVDVPIILADEPTGSLDVENAKIVFEQFKCMVKSRGKSVLMVTHDNGIAQQCDRIFTLNKSLRSYSL